MNRKNLIPLLGIAFAVAVISTWIFYGLVAGRFERAASATARTVVVAKRTLEAGATVSAEDLRSITWTGSDAPEGTFALPSQVVGGRLVDRVGENEPLTQAAVETTEGSRASSGVPVGMRAVSLRASDSQGLMPLIARGSFVDIQAVIGQRDGNVTVRTILERVPVIGLQKPGEDGLAKNEPAVVTVLVGQGDADRLALADSAGKIRLTLRNPADNAGSQAPPTVPTAAATVGKPAPVPMGAVVQPAPGNVPFPSLQMDVSLIATADNGAEKGIRAGEAPALPVKASWSGSGQNGFALVDHEQDGYRVRVALRTTRINGGRFEAVVEPEISWPGATATEVRRLSQNVSWKPGEKLVVRGLSKPDGSRVVLVIAARDMHER